MVAVNTKAKVSLLPLIDATDQIMKEPYYKYSLVPKIPGSFILTEFVTLPLAPLEKDHSGTLISPPPLLSSEPTPIAQTHVLKLKLPLSTLNATPLDKLLILLYLLPVSEYHYLVGFIL